MLIGVIKKKRLSHKLDTFPGNASVNQLHRKIDLHPKHIFLNIYPSGKRKEGSHARQNFKWIYQ